MTGTRASTHGGRRATPGTESAVLLNRRYTFDSIVVARFQQGGPMRRRRRCPENKECHFNPLFIYGEAGLGKTHLLHAIGHLAKSRRRFDAVCRGGAVSTTDYAAAARDRNFGAFRHKYRGVDLLMVDDIQFIGGKRQTQEGFFHVFNHLHETKPPPSAGGWTDTRGRSKGWTPGWCRGSRGGCWLM